MAILARMLAEASFTFLRQTEAYAAQESSMDYGERSFPREFLKFPCFVYQELLTAVCVIK